MPKAKWGSGDEALTAGDIDNAETSSYTPYSGPVAPSGLYRFTVSRMKKGESKSGNPKLLSILTIDGTWKPAHKKYDGCPLFDHMPVTKSSAFRTKAFCEAYGITSREFMTGVITDEDGKITKLASAGDPEGLQVYINVRHVPEANGYSEKLELNGTGYLPVDDTPDDDDDPADDSDDNTDGEEPPF